MRVIGGRKLQRGLDGGRPFTKETLATERQRRFKKYLFTVPIISCLGNFSVFNMIWQTTM